MDQFYEMFLKSHYILVTKTCATVADEERALTSGLFLRLMSTLNRISFQHYVGKGLSKKRELGESNTMITVDVYTVH